LICFVNTYDVIRMVELHFYNRRKRAQEISAILTKYGFEIVLLDIFQGRVKERFHRYDTIPAPDIVPIVIPDIIPKLVPKGIKSKILKQDPNLANLNIYRRFRLAIQELGPVFVKFGQIMSTRQESLPAELIKELKMLNDKVEPVPFGEIKATIEEYAPIEKSFTYLNEIAFAAASLSQEHEAKLKDGSDVVLKVQRPGIREKVAIDLSILKFIASKFDSLYDLNIYNFPGIVEDFSKQITSELDFTRDGKNAELLAKNMEGMKGIRIPKIYWEFSGSRLLVMEHMYGVRIDDVVAIKSMHIDTRDVARNGLHAYLKQIFQDGFFHGDPHPGNLLVTQNGDIAFLDFGLVGILRPEKRDLLLRMLTGVLNADVDELVRVFNELGMKIKDAWVESFKDDLYVNLLEGQNIDPDKPDTEAFLAITNTLRKYRLQIPTVAMLMIKVIMMIGDYSLNIYPGFNFLVEVKPYLGEIVKDRIFSLVKKTVYNLPDTTQEVAQMPHSINEASSVLTSGNLVIRLTDHDVDRLGNRIGTAVKSAANRILIGIVILSGIILYLFFR
jgi:ubiquinone biosynthesis protein